MQIIHDNFPKYKRYGSKSTVCDSGYSYNTGTMLMLPIRVGTKTEITQKAKAS